MKTLSTLALTLSLLAAACAGSDSSTTDVVAGEPAVLVGGFADPLAPVGGRKAEFPVAGQDLQLSDGVESYRVMFGKTPDGASVVARINEVTSEGVTASLDAEGHLVLTTTDSGPGAELHVVGGTALEGLGLTLGESAYGY
jgi:hypothetical protein